MRDRYQQLLQATIEHLEGLKARGGQFVSVSPSVLEALRPGLASSKARGESASGFAGPTTVRTASRAGLVINDMVSSSVRPEPSLAVASTLQPSESPGSSKLAPEAKVAAFAELQQRVMSCVKCPNLVTSRQNVVFGVGDINAQLMFVGEAPGADEDQQGEPFVGRAGQLLTKIIQTMGLSRSSVYIANILKCRPDTPGQPTGNRKPKPEEMQTCIPFLHEQIDLIRPKVIVALGATAVEGLLGKTIGITRLRGQWRTYLDTPLMPTYHPAYLLRNQALTEKRRVWEDMLQVMERLGLPINEKQRNYFL